MKKSFTLAAALVAILTLSAGTANASTTGTHAKHASKKAMFHWFGSAIECDNNGSAALITRFFGIQVANGGSVPNSNFCK